MGVVKLSMKLNYAGGFKEAVEQVVDLEKAGLDVVWVAEAYSFDAISQIGLPGGQDRAGRDRLRHRQRLLPHRRR